MIRVTIRRQDSSQDEVHEFTLPQITVGRVDRNHVVLPNNRVSSVHARVIENEEGIVLVDNNSTNGTFVNGEMVRGPVVLQPHDTVDIGVFTLHFERAEVGHEVGYHDGGPSFEEPQPVYGDYDEFGAGPEPIGLEPEPIGPEAIGPEPIGPDLLGEPVLLGSEPTPADPISAGDVPLRAVERAASSSNSYRLQTETAADSPVLPYGADARRTAVNPRTTEPDPQAEPPRTLDDALALAFRQTSAALLGEPPGPQARARATSPSGS
jgi:predicted component of type VI protein secretion system